mmetsp:Transcript_2929/g.13755  ORF Transcript_2929/g.13755 Transcript_2929/m.13755 type:complete len:208 (+) Transcript_2929:1877-2500(+)
MGPPVHRHKISKPLMRQLMCHNLSNPSFCLGGGLVWIQEQSRFPVGHKTPVLHGSRRKIRNRDHVHLRQRVSNRKEVRKERENFHTAIQSKLSEFRTSFLRVNPKFHSVLCLPFDEVKLCDHKSQQVSRHDWSLVKDHFLLPFGSFFLDDRHIGQTSVGLRGVHRHGEGCLDVRLVKARECHSRVRGFELRHRHELLLRRVQGVLVL